MPKKTENEETLVQEELQNVAQTEVTEVTDPVKEPTPQEEAEPKKPKAPKSEETAVAVKPQAVKPKKVKIMLIQPVDCLINGVRYDYPAQKMIEVPEDVAQILVYGKKAYRM